MTMFPKNVASRFQLLAVVLLLNVLAPLGGLGQSIQSGRCVSVIHGDTIKVLSPLNQLMRVRIAFIDAAEKGQAFGQRAKQAMSELVFGRDVELRPHSIDRYGRLVARVV
jgi:endonuclease YncB( thermonuclease family)